MENEPLGQLYEFAASIIWGGAIGMLYEICGILRFGRGWQTAAADLVFWIITGLSTFIFLLVINGGEPRGFMLLGMAGGAALIRITAGAYLHRAKLALRGYIGKRRAARRACRHAQARAGKK